MFNSGGYLVNTDNIDINQLTLKITSHNLSISSLNHGQIKWILSTVSKIFKQQPIVLNLEAPIKIVGDICGHYNELVDIFLHLGSPANKNYLFLGNYVSRGKNSLQVLLTLFFYKIQYPQNLFMLRGKFQISQNSYIYGFSQQCIKKLGNNSWIQIQKIFSDLPVCATINKQIYCVSSGLSKKVKNIQQIKSISRNSQISETQQIRQMLQSKIKKNYISKKKLLQQSYFSQQDVFNWCNVNSFSLIVRSNEILENGFQFYAKQTLLSICSIPNLLNLNNLGAVLNINQDLVCSFQILKRK